MRVKKALEKTDTYTRTLYTMLLARKVINIRMVENQVKPPCVLRKPPKPEAFRKTLSAMDHKTSPVSILQDTVQGEPTKAIRTLMFDGGRSSA